MKVALICLASVLTISASHATVYSLGGSMDVLQAGTNGGFGAGSGNGTGTILGTYDDMTMSLNYSLTWENLAGSITNAHFHDAPAGSSGGVALGIPGPWASPYSNSATLDAGQEADLLAGNWYVNIHTSSVGGGEIRGQVSVQPVPEPSVPVLALGGIAAMCLRRRRS